MKKLLMAALIAALLVLPLGGVALADEVETSVENLELVEFVPGAVPAAMTPTESISPAVHAIVLAMLNHDISSFERDNSLLLWESLYNMLSLYGQMDARSEYQDELLVLPTETVMDYACVLDPEFDVTAPIPETLSDRLSYEPDSDCFRIVCGSDDLCELRFTSEQGMEISGCLVYLVDDSPLACFRAVLASRDNLFGCTLASLELI